MTTARHLFVALLVLCAASARADNPHVTAVTVALAGGTWRFDVTLTHPDTGWDHYADGWEVLDMAGNRLGFRALAHPHVDEQPFARSLSGVVIAPGTTQVQIRTRCSLDGWAAATTVVDLP